MSDQFLDLVTRVVASLTPPRTVTPDEYRAISCNRCGVCCEDLLVPHPPADLAGVLDAPTLDPDKRAFLAGLVPVAPVAGGWRYRCRHFRRDADGLGVCGVYAERPAVCSRFPYGGVVRRWPGCSWYVQIRDLDGTPLPMLADADPTYAVSAADLVSSE